MKVTQHDTRDPDIADPDRGPGERLRRAREAAGLSTADVAARLRLDERTIHRLEADDVEGLAAPTFVRGYFSSYARLLGLPPGPILEELERSGLEPPPLLADISRQTQARSGDFPVKMVTNLVVLVLIVLVVVWWRNQSETPDNGTERTVAEQAPSMVDEPAPPPAPSAPAPTPTRQASPEPKPEPALPVETEAVAEQVPPADPEPPEAPAADGATTAEAPATETAAPVAMPAESEQPVVVAEDAPAPAAEPVAESEQPAETATPVETTPDTQPVGMAAAPDDAEPASTPAQAPEAEPLPPGQARLQVAFQQESWVEIYDKSGRRLYFNLAKPGARLDLRGEPPFNILLGYAEGVRVEYNGVFFDPMPFAQRGVARFSLGEDELNAQLASRPDGQSVGEPTPQPER